MAELFKNKAFIVGLMGVIALFNWILMNELAYDNEDVPVSPNSYHSTNFLLSLFVRIFASRACYLYGKENYKDKATTYVATGFAFLSPIITCFIVVGASTRKKNEDNESKE